MQKLSAETGLQLAQDALKAYNLAHARLTFLQHSENMTFKVDSASGPACLLRLHVPVTPAFGPQGADARMVNSEIVWLKSLHRARFPSPQPLKTVSGGYVVSLGEINATLLAWQDGELLTRDDETEDTAAQMGTMIGFLHWQASRWRLPAGFIRPTWDMAYFESALATLQSAVSDGRVLPADWEILQTAVRNLRGLVNSRRWGRKQFGLIHADLHRGNFLVHQGRVSLIDFSLCGLGYYAYDLAICLSNIRAVHHAAFLEQYARICPFAPGYERLVEGFFIASYLVTFCHWLENPEAQETLVQRVAHIARQYADKFNHDERFWFTGP